MTTRWTRTIARQAESAEGRQIGLLVTALTHLLSAAVSFLFSFLGPRAKKQSRSLSILGLPFKIYLQGSLGPPRQWVTMAILSGRAKAPRVPCFSFFRLSWRHTQTYVYIHELSFAFGYLVELWPRARCSGGTVVRSSGSALDRVFCAWLDLLLFDQFAAL